MPINVCPLLGTWVSTSRAIYSTLLKHTLQSAFNKNNGIIYLKKYFHSKAFYSSNTLVLYQQIKTLKLWNFILTSTEKCITYYFVTLFKVWVFKCILVIIVLYFCIFYIWLFIKWQLLLALVEAVQCHGLDYFYCIFFGKQIMSYSDMSSLSCSKIALYSSHFIMCLYK